MNEQSSTKPDKTQCRANKPLRTVADGSAAVFRAAARHKVQPSAQPLPIMPFDRFMRSPSRLRLVRPSSIALAPPMRSPRRSGSVPDSALFGVRCPRDPPPAGPTVSRRGTRRHARLHCQAAVLDMYVARPSASVWASDAVVSTRAPLEMRARQQHAQAAKTATRRAHVPYRGSPGRVARDPSVRPSVRLLPVRGRQAGWPRRVQLAAWRPDADAERASACRRDRSRLPPREDPSRSSGWTTSRAGPGRFPPQPRVRRHPPSP